MDSDRSHQRMVPFTCTFDCGSRCELLAYVEDEQLVRVDTPAQRSDTVSRPRLVPCARGRAYRGLLHSRERVLTPLLRSGPRGSGQFEPVSWERALDTVADKLSYYASTFGPASILQATGAGSISGRGLSGGSALARFFSYWNRVTATAGNMSSHCASIAADWMLGGRIPGSDRADLLNSRMILLWGMNPAENRMGPNTEYFVGEARDRGAKVVLLDPRFTDSAVLADIWIPILPGTDAALVAALIYVLETNGSIDRDLVSRQANGYDAYRRYVLGLDDAQPKTPEWAEAITQVPAETTRELARDLAVLKPAAILAGWGPQRTLIGEQSARAMIALATISGNVGVPGGGVGSIGVRSNVIRLPGPPFGDKGPARTLSAVTWADSVLRGALDPPIKMAYIAAANLVNRSANTNANVAALKALDFVVVNEPVLTPTARLADVVLPICTDLERSDLVTSWGHDLHLFDSQQAVAPSGESRTDYWVFAQLAGRLGFGPLYTRGRTADEWVAALRSESPFAGQHGGDGVYRRDGQPRVALHAFSQDPLAHPLLTQSGRIELANAEAAAYGLPVIPSYVPDASHGGDSAGALRLVTPHSRLRSNSCWHANPWLRALEPHAIWINPVDAEERGIADGSETTVRNPQGVMRIRARVTDRIIPGVVCIYQGAWYAPGEDGVDEGGCANTLTPQRTSPTGGMATHSAWVEASPCR